MKIYTTEQIVNVLREVKKQEKTVYDISRDFGISAGTIIVWAKKVGIEPKKPPRVKRDWDAIRIIINNTN